MTIIVGLGNPGTQYENTRHNVGFRVIDRIRENLGSDDWKLEKKFHAEVSKASEFTLLKPQEYMNLSGKAAKEFAQFYKIPPENIAVLQDDLSITFGMLRYRIEGSSGGHKGISSMEEELGTDVFRRFKIGIGPKEPAQIPAEDFVLQKFSKQDEEKLERIIPAAAKAVLNILADPEHSPETLHILGE